MYFLSCVIMTNQKNHFFGNKTIFLLIYRMNVRNNTFWLVILFSWRVLEANLLYIHIKLYRNLKESRHLVDSGIDKEIFGNKTVVSLVKIKNERNIDLLITLNL